MGRHPYSVPGFCLGGKDGVWGAHTNDQEENKDDDDLELESNDETEGDEEMDDTTDQFDDDADVRLEKPTETASNLVQDAEIVSPLDVHVYHEVPRIQAPTLLAIPVSVIPESSPVVTNFPQSSHTFTPTPILATPTPSPTIQTTNPLSYLPEFSFEVSNFAPPVIEKLFHETLDEVTLTKASSQPKSTYEAASTLTEFELNKILLDKMKKSESYLTAPEHQECYDGLKKSYALDQDFFYSYDVYTLKRGRKDKDKDEDPFAGSDRGLKRRKTSKNAKPATDPK
ncbi:hypothetical protein Tco_1223422, partial [Tanacetum coccineum]